MELADRIREKGFRKWYEGELLSGHAHLVLCFLCVVGVVAAFKAASRAQSLTERAYDGMVVVACAAAGLWALRRYLYRMTRAEAIAQQADCPQCGTYARFTLVQSDPGQRWVRVCCRQCSREWQIDDDG